MYHSTLGWKVIKKKKHRKVGGIENNGRAYMYKTRRGGAQRCRVYRGTSLIRNSPLPQDHHKALCIVLL